MRRTSGATELLDGPLDARTLRANLRDLARLNRWLGGVDLSWRALASVGTADRETSLLDIGTGAGDIPRALLRRSRRAGRSMRIVATDVRQEMVAIAAAGPRDPRLEIRLGGIDGIADPDASFDVVHSSLVLHHLEPEGARRLLGEMARVARVAVIVNDLDRAAAWWLGAWLLSHALTLNRYTRHDAPLSVRRAYTVAEVTAMARVAGLRRVASFRARPGYRYALVFEPQSLRNG